MNPSTGTEPQSYVQLDYGARDGDAQPPASDPRSLVEIADDIWQKAETLIRQELKLGLADAEDRVRVLQGELGTKVTELKRELSAQVLGGAVLYAGLLSVIAAVVLLFAKVVDPWLSALIVGAVVGGIGFALTRRKLQATPNTSIGARDLIPRRAVESTKRDVQAIEEAVK